MGELELKAATYRYDITRALFDGSVGIDGASTTFDTAEIVSDMFERMIRDRAYDVSELGLTFYLRTLDFDNPPFVALPVFPNRQFRHSAIFVNTSSGIETPEDLVGKTVGEFATYGHDAGVVAKGVLSDEYGVTPDQCRWVIGGFDWPMEPFDFIPFLHPENVDVTVAPAGKVLGPMLDAGEIDALISADVPQCVLKRSPNVRRLFPDYESLERDYYRRTGIFPAMHTVVARTELLAQHPGLAESIFRAFTVAKDTTIEQYHKAQIFNNMNVQIPWLFRVFDDNRRLFGDDLWPYGLAANRKMADTWLRWHFEQGLSARRLTPEDVFASELLGT